MKLETQNLLKIYNKRTVVKEVSFHISQGEVVGLLGANGAGKTTSFYMVVRIIRPNAGKIYIDNKDITSLPMYKRARQGIGYLPQEASVFRKLSVEDNIMSILEAQKTNRQDRQEQLQMLLEELQIEHIRESKGMSLSGGERRRVEIARALASKPAFILLDEPFAALDALRRERMNLGLLRLWEKRRMTVVMVTHNIQEALFLSTRVLVMSQRPGQLAGEFPIVFAYPREKDLFYEEKFVDLSHRVRDTIQID